MTENQVDINKKIQEIAKSLPPQLQLMINDSDKKDAYLEVAVRDGSTAKVVIIQNLLLIINAKNEEINKLKAEIENNKIKGNIRR